MKPTTQTAAPEVELPGMSPDDAFLSKQRLEAEQRDLAKLVPQLQRKKAEQIARAVKDKLPVPMGIQKEIDDAISRQGDIKRSLEWLDTEGQRQIILHEQAKNLPTLVKRRDRVVKLILETLPDGVLNEFDVVSDSLAKIDEVWSLSTELSALTAEIATAMLLTT